MYLGSRLLPALSGQKSVKPLRDVRILLKEAEITSISGHLAIWDMEEISKSHLVSSKILVLCEKSFVDTQRGVE